MAEADPRSPRERMLAGDDHIASDPEIVRDSRCAIALCERYNATSVERPDERRRILVELLGTAPGSAAARSCCPA